MIYKVVLQKSEEGYCVLCPTLESCWSQGETEEDALELMLRKISFHPVLTGFPRFAAVSRVHLWRGQPSETDKRAF